MENRFIINQSQLDDIDRCKLMISNIADSLRNLCNRDGTSDINIGFELGKIYTDLRSCVSDMYELEIDIESQIITDDDVPF